MDLPTILPEYQLSFLEGSGNDDLFGNHFGSPGNPNRAFFHRLFGLRKFCEETFLGFFARLFSYYFKHEVRQLLKIVEISSYNPR